MHMLGNKLKNVTAEMRIIHTTVSKEASSTKLDGYLLK